MPPPSLSLVPKKRLTAAQAQRLKASIGRTLAACPDEAPLVEAAIRREIDRVTEAAQPEWAFIMVSPAYLSDAIEWAATKAPRRTETVRILGLIWRHIDRRDGRVTLTHAQIADALGLRSENVGRCMKALAKQGYLRRMEVGRTVIYALSPWLATRLPAGDAAAARDGAPKPRLATDNGQAVATPSNTVADPRQVDIEDAIAEQMCRAGRLPWDAPAITPRGERDDER